MSLGHKLRVNNEVRIIFLGELRLNKQVFRVEFDNNNLQPASVSWSA